MQVTRGKRKAGKLQLNLIPILDAVFIFIFFLLSTAQFVEIRETQIDIPKVSVIEVDKNEKDPLALTLTVAEDKIEIVTGLEQKIYKEIVAKNNIFDMGDLHRSLVELKLKHPEETTAIIIPQEGVKYKNIVSILDHIKVLAPKEKSIAYVDSKGEKKETRKLFYNISFGEKI